MLVMLSLETSIEITETGKIYCEHIDIESVKHFLRLFALSSIEEDQIKYYKMNKGMVNFNKKDVVISFGIILTDAKFEVRNLLSSMSFDETKEFISKIVEI